MIVIVELKMSPVFISEIWSPYRLSLMLSRAWCVVCLAIPLLSLQM